MSVAHALAHVAPDRSNIHFVGVGGERVTLVSPPPPPTTPEILSKTMLLFAPTKRSCIVKRDVQNRRNYLGWHRPRHLFGTEEPRKVYFNNTCVERARRRLLRRPFLFRLFFLFARMFQKRDNRCLSPSASSLMREILKKKIRQIGRIYEKS